MKPEEVELLDRFAERKRTTAVLDAQTRKGELEIKLASNKDRMSRLTDAYVDCRLEPEMYSQRKETLLSERLDYESQLRELDTDPAATVARIEEYVGLVKALYLRYKLGSAAEKRQLFADAMLDASADEKTLVFTLRSELSELLTLVSAQSGGPTRVESEFTLQGRCSAMSNSATALHDNVAVQADPHTSREGHESPIDRAL